MDDPAQHDPCLPETAVSADGARLTACALGATVLGWVPASGGPDRLWVSPGSSCGPGRPVRGGIPLVFPQFGAGPLPKHGFLRDRAWRAVPTADPDAAVLQYRLSADATTRAVWPWEFTAELVARASGQTLSVELLIRNDDRRAFEFTACLHAYFAVPGADQAVLTGLQGRTASDKNNAGADWEAPTRPFSLSPPADLVFEGADGPVACSAGGRQLVVSSHGLPDMVVWNPGPGHGLADVPEGAERGFLCVEPAAVLPVSVPPGATWVGSLNVVAG